MNARQPARVRVTDQSVRPIRIEAPVDFAELMQIAEPAGVAEPKPAGQPPVAAPVVAEVASPFDEPAPAEQAAPAAVTNPFAGVTLGVRQPPAQAAPVAAPMRVSVPSPTADPATTTIKVTVPPAESNTSSGVVNPFETRAADDTSDHIGRTNYQPEMMPAPPGEEADYSSDQWSPKPIDDLGVNVRMPDGVFPRDYAAELPQETIGPYDPLAMMRGWAMTVYLWEASNFCHRPLYFEEMNLERHGYGCCHAIQPAVSAAHFFGTVPMLPYLWAVDCPCDCDYTLGRYRPGSCVPWRPLCTKPSILGGASEAGVVTGLIFLIP